MAAALYARTTHVGWWQDFWRKNIARQCRWWAATPLNIMYTCQRGLTVGTGKYIVQWLHLGLCVSLRWGNLIRSSLHRAVEVVSAIQGSTWMISMTVFPPYNVVIWCLSFIGWIHDCAEPVSYSELPLGVWTRVCSFLSANTDRTNVRNVSKALRDATDESMLKLHVSSCRLVPEFNLLLEVSLKTSSLSVVSRTQRAQTATTQHFCMQTPSLWSTSNLWLWGKHQCSVWPGLVFCVLLKWLELLTIHTVNTVVSMRCDLIQ